MENDAGLEVRVGYASTGVLLGLVEDYVRVHSRRGFYVGDLHWLLVYKELVGYQKTAYRGVGLCRGAVSGFDG